LMVLVGGGAVAFVSIGVIVWVVMQLISGQMK
jgi:hypothetical protein